MTEGPLRHDVRVIPRSCTRWCAWCWAAGGRG